MKILDTFKAKKLKPKPETILFLHQFSKSLAIVKTKSVNHLISKN